MCISLAETDPNETPFYRTVTSGPMGFIPILYDLKVADGFRLLHSVMQGVLRSACFEPT